MYSVYTAVPSNKLVNEYIQQQYFDDKDVQYQVCVSQDATKQFSERQPQRSQTKTTTL